MPTEEKKANLQYGEAVLREHERVCSEIRNIEINNRRVIGFGLSIIGVGFAYGVSEKVSELMFFVPVALAGVFLFAMLQYNNLFWFGGYKRLLEKQVNEAFGKPVVSWESVVNQRPRIHVINGSLVAVYVLVAVAATIFSLIEVITLYPPLVYWSFTALIVSLYVAALLSARRMARAYGEAVKAASLAAEEVKGS